MEWLQEFELSALLIAVSWDGLSTFRTRLALHYILKLRTKVSFTYRFKVAQNVYERLVEAGREYSLMHAGYYTLRQLRIEKFYVYWGQDINATVTPVECGRSFRVDFKVHQSLSDVLVVKTLMTDTERRERSTWWP